MNAFFIRSVIEAFTFLILSFNSIFDFYQVKELNINVNNADVNKSLSIINTILDYETEIIYSSNIPSGITNILVKGQDGIVYLDGTGKIYKTLKEKINEVVEVGTGKQGEYTGIVTGYGPDCVTCDGRGYVACPTKTGKWTNLITDGIYYEDPKYGSLRIVAADHREFPCGTVVEISNSDLATPILGIVLDTGAAMRNAYNNGNIHFDVAFETEVGLTFGINKNTNFSVKRWGW